MLKDCKTEEKMQRNRTHLTKQALFQCLSKKTGLSKKNIDLVFLALLDSIKDHMKKDGSEKFVFPGIFKLTVKTAPEQKEKIGLNPFTKEKMIFKAKKASRNIKIKALKKLKDTVK